jgi:hypothetical protein
MRFLLLGTSFRVGISVERRASAMVVLPRRMS